MASFRDLVLLVLGRGLQLLAGLVTIKVATTILSPGQVGAVNQVMSLALFVPSAVLAPIAIYIQRGLFQWMEEETLRQKLLIYLRIVLIAGAVCGLAALAIQTKFELVSGISAAWIGALIAVYVLGFSIHTMSTSGLNLLGHRIDYVVFTNIALWGGLAFALYLSIPTSSPERWLSGLYSGFLLSSLSFMLL